MSVFCDSCKSGNSLNSWDGMVEKSDQPPSHKWRSGGAEPVGSPQAPWHAALGRDSPSCSLSSWSPPSEHPRPTGGPAWSGARSSSRSRPSPRPNPGHRARPGGRWGGGGVRKVAFPLGRRSEEGVVGKEGKEALRNAAWPKTRSRQLKCDRSFPTPRVSLASSCFHTVTPEIAAQTR